MNAPNTYKHLFDTQGHLTEQGLKQYATSHVTEEERTAIEQHTAICEMCADAAEGLGMFADESTLQTHISNIHQHVDERTQKQHRVVPFYRRYLSAAAVVLILFGVAWSTSTYFFTSETQDIAEAPLIEATESLEEDSTEEQAPSNDGANNTELDKDNSLSKTNKPTKAPVEVEAEKPSDPTQTISNNNLFKAEDLNDANSEQGEPSGDIPTGGARTDTDTYQWNAAPAVPQTEPSVTEKADDNKDKVQADTHTVEPTEFESLGYISDDIEEVEVEDELLSKQTQDRSSSTGISPRTMLDKYLKDFTPSSTSADKYVTGTVKATISFNRKGQVKEVVVTEGLNETIDTEVIEYLEKIPTEVLPNKSLKELKVEVPIP